KEGDTVNRALSAGNACLYGLCHAAIVSLGFSPGLGFLHSGKQLSFVYDAADLYKMEVVVPAALSAAGVSDHAGERRVRSPLRAWARRPSLPTPAVVRLRRGGPVRDGGGSAGCVLGRGRGRPRRRTSRAFGAARQVP